MGRLASLTSRLVVTAVALVLLVSLLIGTVATLAVRSYLLGQVDDDVRAALQRAEYVAASQFFVPCSTPAPPAGGVPDDLDDRDRGPGDGDDPGRGQSVGTLTAFFEKDAGTDPAGCVLTPGEDGRPGTRALSTAALDLLADLPADGRPREVDLPGVGSYRVAVRETATGGYTVAAGLPTDDLDGVVSTLVTTEVVLILLGGAVAGLAGLLVVRRQLRPLREVADTAHTVAELPLAQGEIDLTERVPAHLTDERTEVGRVGSALNTLLDHVESSLEARHRSELQVRQFVADASHELRTPLATIAGYTELARRRPDDATAVTTALAKVEEESGRMTSLVEDLLLLARLDAGRPLESAPVDLTRLLLEAVSDARVLSPDHHWRLELPEEAPAEVDGDEQRLHQVVTNLLTNARKYTPAGSTVTVTALPEGFRVHDDGPGFPPELLDHAFERFARGDTARTRGGAAAPGGAGLGLALVEAIVTAHGGRVTLVSRPGDTAVEVTLPGAVD